MMTRAQRTGLAAVLGVAACFAGSATARGAEPGSAMPVTVVAVRTDDAYDQAEALTKALRVAIKSSEGWSLGEGDFSLEVLTLSLKCPDIPDEGCQSRIADQLKTDRYIWGVLHKKGDVVQGELHLWSRGQEQSVTTVDYSANLTEAEDEALRKIAAAALQVLTGGRPRGTLRVKAKTATGQVFVDGAPVATLSNGEAVLELPPGPHSVVVQSPGFTDAESPVVIQSAGTSELSLSQTAAQPSRPVNWRQVGGFAGVGAGVAFGTVAILSSVQILSIEDDPRFKAYTDLFAEGKVENTCTTEAKDSKRNVAEARDGIALCEKGDTLTAVQYVFYPLALFSAGVGAYLLLTKGDAPASPQTGWTVLPSVGMELGKIDVTYRW
jgi:hypothetical protein